MELTQSQISEIISNYTSNVMAFVPVVGIVMALSFLFVFHTVAVVISIWFFQA